MKAFLHGARTHRNTPLLRAGIAVLAFAVWNTACVASPDDGGTGPEPLPTPGTIDVIAPPKLADRARVPEREAGFVSAEVSEGLIVIAHDGSLRAFSPGEVLGGTAGGGFLAKVVSARAIDGRHVAIDTAPAALTELLSEGEVHVHYDAAEYMERLQRFVDAQRTLGEEDGERLASSAEALRATVGKSITLLELAGKKLPARCGVHASGKARIDVSARLTPIVDLDLKIGAKGGGNPLPELKRFRLIASGQLDVETTLHGKGTLSGDCSVDLLALAGGAANIPLPPLTFWVGPVPVVVTTDVVPTVRADIGLSLDAAEVDAQAQASVGLLAGAVYEDHQWSTIWSPWGTGDGAADIQSPGDVFASCEVSAGAELRARLYGVMGPNLGVEAYARAEAVTEPPYCTYDAWIDGGVRAHASAALGVSVGPLDLTLAEMDLVDLDVVHFDGPELSGALRDAPECSEPQ